MPASKWTRETVAAEAKKYKGVRDFKFGSRGAYEYAQRLGIVGEITAFMAEIEDADVLMARIEGELGSAARHAKVAKDMWDADPSPFYEPSNDPELISEGTYLDFDAQMNDQAAFERSDRALDHIEALKKHGTPQQVHEAWVMYLAYQTGEWEVDTVTMGISMQGEEQGGSND